MIIPPQSLFNRRPVFRPSFLDLLALDPTCRCLHFLHRHLKDVGSSPAKKMEKNNGVDVVPNEVFGAPSLKKGSRQDNDSEEALGLLTQPDHTTATKSYLSHHWPFIYWFIKFVLVVGTASIFFSIPIIYYRDAEFLADDITDEQLHEILKSKVTDIWLYNIFLFIQITWLGIASFFLIGSALPYIFRFIAR